MKSRRNVWSRRDLMGIPALVLKCLATVLSSPPSPDKKRMIIVIVIWI